MFMAQRECRAKEALILLLPTDSFIAGQEPGADQLKGVSAKRSTACRSQRHKKGKKV
jgi:hypothetical protein